MILQYFLLGRWSILKHLGFGSFFSPLSPYEYLHVNQENAEMTFVQC